MKDIKHFRKIEDLYYGSATASNLGNALADIIGNHVLAGDIDIVMFMNTETVKDKFVYYILAELNSYNNLMSQLDDISNKMISIMTKEVSKKTGRKLDDIHENYKKNHMNAYKEFKNNLYRIIHNYSDGIYNYEGMKHRVLVISKKYLNDVFWIYDDVKKQYNSLSNIFDFY